MDLGPAVRIDIQSEAENKFWNLATEELLRLPKSQDSQEHSFITDWQNMYITVGVLEKLRKLYPTQKLVLVWDNCGWHRGSKVTEWIEQDTNTEAIYFPPYTPDLNPQEHVWKAGRKAVTHNQCIQKIEETAERFKTYLETKTFSYELLGLRAEQSWQD